MCSFLDHKTKTNDWLVKDNIILLKAGLLFYLLVDSTKTMLPSDFIPWYHECTAKKCIGPTCFISVKTRV